MTPEDAGPLQGLEVLDLLSGPMAAIGRALADLGARTTRIEPPGGQPDRPAPGDDPLRGLAFAVRNAGKGSVVHDPEDAGDRARLAARLGAAHAVLLDLGPDARLRLDPDDLRARFPGLVVVGVSDFGMTPGFSRWRAADPVMHALSGSLSRSGIEGAEPLIPPGRIAEGSAASQALMLTLAALYARMRRGGGALLDIALVDGAALALDPVFGIAGAAGVAAAQGLSLEEIPRPRPPVGAFYPILPCADGRVRICVLSPRQWQAMFAWMGRPAAFADPRFAQTRVRFETPALNAAIAAFFADKTRAELEAEGGARGVPVGALLTLDEALATGHVAARGALTRVPTLDGGTATLPDGVAVIDGRRAGPRRGPPALGEALPDAPAAPFPAPEPAAPGAGPLAGLKVLDLGVIVVGAEQGRILADLGADVLKVESRAFPDGTRASMVGVRMTASFAVGHRNKRSLGLNLRAPEGRALFLRLAAEADLVLSNFKPGTMEKLGLGPEALSAANPRLVTVESSAFGDVGPWAGRMGYGPLVRASAGLTEQWRYPEVEDGFSDAVTIYPDHAAARFGLAAALSLLIRRLRTGRGGRASISQAEVMFAHLEVDIARRAAGLPERAPGAPWGVFPCAGEDAWCAVAVGTDAHWAALARALGRPELAWDPDLAAASGRLADPAAAEAPLRAWLAGRSPQEAMADLQAAGVPAGAMLRPVDLPEWAERPGRGLYRRARHPLVERPYLEEAAPARVDAWPAPPSRPAPLAGEHSLEAAAEWLGLPPCETARLLHEGVLEVPDAPLPA
ncbi:CaiB/BaiF CoA-transferase family protein [Albimonas pacifica]|uniref:Crotonobetainyl-CoA:carnitine CoA-transferase CaiB n=1 Tax=Albimonas pacifica TaxID=1114924 RepID=A0A1I3FBF8_9RHOB|nr:CoA transferase [Albimonas pacifica]SFI08519.1 Crotonobetainyl-CoA:carnitine CoA-transferase CaiB [Albimonas pacifica]